MASIERRTPNGQVRWYLRDRHPAGAQHTKTFDRKVHAERFLTNIEASKLTGSCVSPKHTARKFRDVADEHWLAHMHSLAADSTRPRKRSTLDRHILPAHGDYPIGAIKRSTVAGAVCTWSQT